MDSAPPTSRSHASLGHGWWLASVLLHAALLLVIFDSRASVTHGRNAMQIIEVSLVEGPKGGQPMALGTEPDRKQTEPPRQTANRKETKKAKAAPSTATMAPDSGRTILQAVEATAALSPGIPAAEMAEIPHDSEASGAKAESGSSAPFAEGGTSRHTTGGDLHSRKVDAALILGKIEAAKRYPPVARKMGLEGTPVVRFKLEPSGQVESAEIVKSSGSEILDRAALKNIHDAAPLPYVEGWQKVEIVFKLF